jgi:ribosomal-protein-alanine N-acetyltransferase
MIERRRCVVSLQIRPVTKEDVRQVVDIERSSFPFPWSTSAFLQLASGLGYALSIEGNAVLMRVLSSDEGVLGYIVWEQRAKDGHLMNLAVRKGQRRRGYGRLLFESAVDSMKQSGLNGMTLEVEADNAPAIALYESMGMVASGRATGFYGDTDAIIYDCQF